MDLMLKFSLSSAKVKCFSDTTKFYWKFLCSSGKYMYLCTRKASRAVTFDGGLTNRA